MFLKGPLVTQPPPVPDGSQSGGYGPGIRAPIGSSLGMWAPFPEREVSLPSNSWDFSRSSASAAQSQYLVLLISCLLAFVVVCYTYG